MADKMKRYIEEQPQIWQKAMQSLPETVCRAAKKMCGADAAVRRVVMIGSGSSHYAADAACRLLVKDGNISFFAAVPEAMGSLERPDDTTLYWAVSQSGKSTSTEQAVTRLRKMGARIAAFTADPEFPLFDGEKLETAMPAASHTPDGPAMPVYVEIPCGTEDIGPKTKGMTTTLLTLWLAGQALLCSFDSKKVEKKAALLASAFQSAAENLAFSTSFAKVHSALLSAAPYITVIAGGAAFPLAQEGALKLLETLYVPAFAWEFEEYLHGVHNSMAEGSVFLFVLRPGPDLERMKRLAAYCRAQGCVCLLIDCTGHEPADSFTLPLICSGPEEALGYSLLLPFQVISAIVSEYKGIDCDFPRFPDFYAALCTKLQV